MNKRRTVFLSSGLPSMFVIFSILCMVILSLLALGTSRQDLQTSQMSLDQTTAYYKACSDATAQYTEITEYIRKTAESASDKERYLSQMKNMYQDQEAVEEILKHEDPLIYEFYELGCPERAGDLAFGTTMIHPGKIGNEYYMTKGHFHQIVDTAEVYYTLKGEGYMMLESLDGDWRVERMEKGKALYVPRGYAHRTINTGDEVLTAFYVFDADAGHDYGTIETKGYRHIVCEINGEVTVLDNPRW